MQLGPGDVAGLPGIADHLALGHEIAALDQKPVGMRVGGGVAALVLDQHQVAIAFQLVARIGNSTAGRGADRCIHRRGDIDAVIPAAVGGGAEVGNHRPRDRPGEGDGGRRIDIGCRGPRHGRQARLTHHRIGPGRGDRRQGLTVDIGPRAACGADLGLTRGAGVISDAGGAIVHIPIKHGFGRGRHASCHQRRGQDRQHGKSSLAARGLATSNLVERFHRRCPYAVSKRDHLRQG